MAKLYSAIITLENILVAEDVYGDRLEYNLNEEEFPKWVLEGIKGMKMEVRNNIIVYR